MKVQDLTPSDRVIRAGPNPSPKERGLDPITLWNFYKEIGWETVFTSVLNNQTAIIWIVDGMRFWKFVYVECNPGNHLIL